MGRLDEIEMLVAAGRAAAHDVQGDLNKIVEALQTSAATGLLSGIDVCHAQLAATAVGVFSIYESRLQARFGWEKPFDELKSLLKSSDAPDLAESFDNYQLAVNVFKHGEGSSHKKLLARAEGLPFKAQKQHGDSWEEGDVCPPNDLIPVSVEFLEECCDVIEKSWAVVQGEASNLAREVNSRTVQGAGLMEEIFDPT